MEPIQFVDLKKQYEPLKDEILTGIARALEGMHLFLGENVQALEKEFTGFSQSSFGIGVSDGTQALHLILRALGVGPGDEVITVSHTFIASVEAIVLAGARPVFVDIHADTYLMDVSQVEEKITEHTKAVLPVHLYGQTVDMDPLLDIARRHGLFIVEDACQAHGAEYKGRRAGSMGDAGAFSFYFSKNLGAYGEGGFITTNDPELYRRARMMRDHGSEVRYQHELIGMNARLDEIQAVVLRAKLPYLAAWNERRREIANRYNELLKDLPVITPVTSEHNCPVFHLYVIRVEKRNELQAFLKERGVFTGIHYPIPNHQQKALKYLGYQKGDFPVTDRITNEILSLPMHAEMSEDQIRYVVDCMKEFFQKP